MCLSRELELPLESVQPWLSPDNLVLQVVCDVERVLEIVLLSTVERLVCPGLSAGYTCPPLLSDPDCWQDLGRFSLTGGINFMVLK